MKKIILKDRGCGKTARIIELTTPPYFEKKDHFKIVVSNSQSHRDLERKLRETDIPFSDFPAIQRFNSFILGEGRKPGEKVFIDNLDDCLRHHSDMLQKLPNLQLMNKIEGFSCSTSSNKMDEVAYISGPISGHDIQEQKMAFAFAENYLLHKGIVPINPFHIKQDDISDWESCMKNDIKYLMGCDQIFVLKGWKDSKGAKLEVELSMNLGMKIVFE